MQGIGSYSELAYSQIEGFDAVESSAANRASAFNFCDPFDHVLPPADASVSILDRQHLWGLYAGISTFAAPVFAGTIADISVVENTGTYNYDLSTYFTGATSYSISPAVETGWSFNVSTAELIIDTDDVGGFGPYTATGTNVGGSDNSNAFTVTVTEAQAAGGGGAAWWGDYEYEYRLRDRKRKALLELEAKAEKISDKIDRELAKELRAQDKEIARVQELRRLSTLAQKHQKELQGHLNQRAIKAAEAAFESGTYSMMERMEREIARSREEEQFLIEATRIILEQ